ncbi:TetR/AcrR family transcriptional regulator [Bosea caraganae]|uniref:TetR/AcrR family transcriptional regulator n=1 Tax=Bosea caraganae TaxID=2763117 RepID=A0A370L7M2_9HYPH|nr:TetR/AcrR family transcriptional regulator [Bosea caraganae]RDJ25308.1 TetR/AcrR family transcriptional regulator [Bosea caraganae]RDJ25908.1 TetR/AcrR family transcriptional regulator [Bosea caraganae]
MARKPASPPTAEPSVSAAPADPRRLVVGALFKLAADRPWDEIELTDIATEAGVSLAALRNLFPSKLAILGGLTRIVDEAVLAGTSDDLAAEPARERMFDLVMRRLDALTPYKEGLRKIMPVLRRDPLTLAALNRASVNSWRYMLASVGIPTEDRLGPVRVQGAVLLMARVAETWLDDDEAEQSRTLARLDRELKTASWVLSRAEDLHRLTAPLRGLARALCSARPRVRRRERGDADRRGEDYAPAI